MKPAPTTKEKNQNQAAINTLNNKKKRQTKAKDSSTKMNILNARDLFAANDIRTQLQQQTSLKQVPVSTIETIIQNSSTPIRNVLYLLVGHIETLMCTNYHDELYNTLAYVLDASGLLQYVDLQQLVEVARNANTLFTNLTPNSKFAYIAIPVKPDLLIETRNCYTTITTTAVHRFGYQTDASGQPTNKANSTPPDLSSQPIDHTVALMTTPISEQSQVFLAGRNFTHSLSNFVCMRILNSVLPLSSPDTSFTVLYHLLENEFKPDDPRRTKPLFSTEPCFVVLIPLSTTQSQVDDLRKAFMDSHPQDFFWENITSHIQRSETIMPGLQLELSTSLMNFIGRRFLKIYNYNFIEISGLVPHLEDKTAFQALVKTVPTQNIVCFVRACSINNGEGKYYIFVNTNALTSVNIESLREFKAPNCAINHGFKTELIGFTGSKFSIPDSRSREKSHSQNQRSDQVKPVVSQRLETNELIQTQLTKVLLEEIKFLRAEVHQVHVKIDNLTSSFQQMNVNPECPTAATQLHEQTSSPPRKIRDLTSTTTSIPVDMVLQC